MSAPLTALLHQIDLPPYKDYASLEQKLTLAVEETVGFGCVYLIVALPSSNSYCSQE